MSAPVNYYDSGLCTWRHVVTEFARQTEDQWRRQHRLAEVLQAAEDATPETHEQAWAAVWQCLGWNADTARERYLARRAGQ